MGHFHIQFFMSMMSIVAVACVALICDFLKRKDEELREAAVDVRGEPEAAPRQAAPKRRSVIQNERKRTSNAGALAAIHRGEALAGTRVRPTADRPGKNKRSMLSRDAQRAEPALAPLPEGFQDQNVLRKLVESRSRVTGLVVSIGVNESSDSVRGLVESWISPSDFAVQSREGEFVLIYPEKRGAAAKRKLNEIAERCRIFNSVFWDRPKSCFSWGGVEVQNASVDEAIATASERRRLTESRVQN